MKGSALYTFLNLQYAAGMDVLVVAGEASGDQHAAALVSALKNRVPAIRFFGMGGPKLAAEGVEILFESSEISVMGIVEVLPKLRRILRVLAALEATARDRRPDFAILVDVPDFNLRLAARLKKLGIRVVSYVAPTVWAWRQGRTRTIARDVELLICILPFEEAFLRDRGVNAHYVGHPLLDALPAVAPESEFRRRLGLLVDAPTVAILPGSRLSEISRMVPTLVEVCRRLHTKHPFAQFVIPVAPGLSRERLAEYFEGSGISPTWVEGRAPEVVGASTVAVVASGTATLEAGLMRRPLVAVYRLNSLSYWIGRALVKIPFFCLVNLLLDRQVVPEFLQSELTPEAVERAVLELWEGEKREACLRGLDELRQVLGASGASDRAAELILSTMAPGAAPLPSC
jgi:lipid-A-disaccharide synthase